MDRKILRKSPRPKQSVIKERLARANEIAKKLDLRPPVFGGIACPMPSSYYKTL